MPLNAYGGMPLRTKLVLVWVVLGVVGISWVLAPYAEVAAPFIVLGIAPPATLFAVIYGFTVSWWETTIGQAMLISSAALALLVDISLLYQWLGDDYFLRDAVRLAVFNLILLGAWWKFVALVRSKWMAWRERRADGLS